MNVAVPFIRDFQYLDQVQELNIKYNHQEDDYIALVKFIEEYPNHRINIELLAPGADTEALKALEKHHNGLYFKLPEFYLGEHKAFQDLGLRYYYTVPAINWSSLDSLVKAGVSDVFIGEELGFNIPKVKKVLEVYGISIRVIINEAQSTDITGEGDPLKDFFIRPEDLEMFEGIIDTIEFYYVGKKSQIGIFYQVYMIDKYWFGDLADLIAGLRISIDSRTLLPEFTFYRRQCGLKCYKGSSCALCKVSYELSVTMLEQNLFINRSGEEEEDGSEGSEG